MYCSLIYSTFIRRTPIYDLFDVYKKIYNAKLIVYHGSSSNSHVSSSYSSTEGKVAYLYLFK